MSPGNVFAPDRPFTHPMTCQLTSPAPSRPVCFSYERHYESTADLQQRYAAFQDSMAMIEAHNSQESRTYSLGINSEWAEMEDWIK